MIGTLKEIELWHEKVCPDPDEHKFNVQLGCHLEEFAEMLATLRCNDFRKQVDIHNVQQVVTWIANDLKSGVTSVEVVDRLGFLDSLADQIVTAVGAGYRKGMNVPAAAVWVNQSNWSKFDENGDPIFDRNGKVMKGPAYHEPDLAGLY